MNNLIISTTEFELARQSGNKFEVLANLIKGEIFRYQDREAYKNWKQPSVKIQSLLIKQKMSSLAISDRFGLKYMYFLTAFSVTKPIYPWQDQIYKRSQC